MLIAAHCKNTFKDKRRSGMPLKILQQMKSILRNREKKPKKTHLIRNVLSGRQAVKKPFLLNGKREKRLKG